MSAEHEKHRGIPEVEPNGVATAIEDTEEDVYKNANNALNSNTGLLEYKVNKEGEVLIDNEVLEEIKNICEKELYHKKHPMTIMMKTLGKMYLKLGSSKTAKDFFIEFYNLNYDFNDWKNGRIEFVENGKKLAEKFKSIDKITPEMQKLYALLLGKLFGESFKKVANAELKALRNEVSGEEAIAWAKKVDKEINDSENNK